MSNHHFYIQKYTRKVDTENEKVYYESTSEVKDLETDFPLVRYKSCSGLNNLGEAYQYTETFAESEQAQVYIPEGESVVRKQTEITLTVYVFGYEPEKTIPASVTEEALRDNIESAYADLMDFLSGGFVCYWDTVRKRKVMTYQYSSVSVKTDKLYGVPYKQVDIKFKNVYGRSFSLSDEVFNPIS